MWKASAGIVPNIQNDGNNDDDDDWETDPDFVNDVTEEEQRWGSKTVEGSGRLEGSFNVQQICDETFKADAERKRKEFEETKPNFGYGGKFGIEKDRVDKSAVGWDHLEKLEKHESQKDYAKGFGGKYGVQDDRKDKSALNWEYKEKVEKHSSQKDYSEGFGGKFGVQKDRVDKSAVGWDHVEKIEKHESQKDYAKGFGGKYGIQEDRKDKSAIGWEDENKERVGTNYAKTKPDIIAPKSSNLRAKFENLAKNSEEEVKQKAAEQKRVREEKDKFDRDEASKKQVFESKESKSEAIISNESNKTVKTNREHSIGSTINAFNQAQTQNEIVQKQKIQKEQIEPKKIQKIIQPDVIPSKEPDASNIVEKNNAISTEKDQENIVAPPTQFSHEEKIEKEEKKIPQEEAIYQNQEDLSEYIEDTGIKAIALYDYEAAADDEISFDPNDIITHVEMIDEGWWRGLCKNRYGLFPANYVQVINVVGEQ